MNPESAILRKGKTRCLAVLAWVAAVVVRTPAPAQPSIPLAEYAVKAALLFNIAKYVDWPRDAFAGPNDPIVIGVLGDDPFGDLLDQLVHGRSVNGHPITIRRADGIAELDGVHLVFVSAAEPHAAQDCAVLDKSHVLTVGDTGQTALFTTFNFAVQGDKIVFSVDLDRADRAGVRVSSKLLQFAKAVKRADAGQIQ